jgi:hypothetical protein
MAVVLRDILLVAIALAFAVAGVLHGRKNSFYHNAADRNPLLLHFYYTAVAVFGAAVAVFGIFVVHDLYAEIAVAAVLVAVISIARFLTDWVDLCERSGRIDWLRPIADALANFFTIALAIFVSRTQDVALALLCVFFGLMFVAKEFNFRIRDDLFLRRGATRTTSQGGGGKKTDPVVSLLQAFFGRYIKSYLYICVGFAIIYLMLPILTPSVGAFSRKFGSGGENDVADVFVLSIGSMTQLPSQAPLPVLLVALFQWWANAAMAGLVLVHLYARKKR